MTKKIKETKYVRTMFNFFFAEILLFGKNINKSINKYPF